MTESEALAAFNDHVGSCKAGREQINDEWAAFCPAGFRSLVDLLEAEDDPVKN